MSQYPLCKAAKNNPYSWVVTSCGKRRPLPTGFAPASEQLMLTVRLFGIPSFQAQNQVLSHLITGRAAALLTYLIITRQPHSRAQLADLLWADVPEQQAKTNLRYRLSDLRKVVGDYVIATNETVTFNEELPHWVDVTAFTTYMTTATVTTVASPTTPAVEPDLLQELLNLYTGEFLSSFQLEEAPVFESWMQAQRHYLHDLRVKGLQLRTQQHLSQGDYVAGLALNQDLLTLEPWREEMHRQRMVLFALSGQRNAALQQYTRCCQVLAKELDVPPMPETTKLYEEIKSGQWFTTYQANNHRANGHGTNSYHLPAAITAFPTVVPAYRPNGTLPATPPPATSATAEPTTATRRFDLGGMPAAAHFYGRQAELTALHSWVGQEHSQLIALLGLKGQGKTALAAAFVHDVIEEEQSPRHGFTQVIWRALDAVPSCIELLQDWLRQLETGQVEALPASFDQLVTRLFAILQARRCLLVLDGIEAILARSAVDDKNAETYRPGCEAYATLLRLFFQRRHRSCLVLTSHIRLSVLTQLDERNGAFRCLEVSGLSATEGAQFLAAHGIIGAPAIHQQLHHRYAGSPHLLARTANLIHELFDSDGAAFLQEGLYFLGDIGAMLRQLWSQLSPLEQQLLQRLAQAEQPLSRQTLWLSLLPLPAKGDYYHALQHLQRTFLIQQTEIQVKLSELFTAYLAEQALPDEVTA